MEQIKMRLLFSKPSNRTVIEPSPKLNNKPVITTPNASLQYVCGLCGQVIVEASSRTQFRNLVYQCTNPQCRAYNQVE